MIQSRWPRPIGITELGKQYNNTLEDSHYQSLIRGIIHHYIRNNFSYCGIYYNTEQFMRLTGIKELDLKKGIIDFGKELGKLNSDMMGGDVIRAVGGLSLNWVLEDRSAIQQQLAVLLSSQNNEYKPFISGEVGKALKLNMDSTNNLLSFLKSFGGNGTLIPIDPGAPEGTQEKGITADEAVRIFKENRFTPLLENDAQLSKLKKEYDIENMPEVNALLQIGMDTSKEGLSINEITSLTPELLSKLEIEEPKKRKGKHHRERREKELNIDMDQDDI